jgi:uncharacterized protein (DUF58 family)
MSEEPEKRIRVERTIWPGRTLLYALLVPAFGTLGLLAPGLGWLKPSILGLDLAVVVLALVDLGSLRGVQRLKAEREVERVVSLAERFESRVRLSNPSGRTWRFRLEDDRPREIEQEPREFRGKIPGQKELEFESQNVALRRGSYELRWVYVLVESAWGFWRRRALIPCRTLLRVYPDVRQIARYTVLARRDRLAALGVRRSRRLGTDNEFERLRDYLEGDEPRHIDWRATARRRKLTVRAHQTNQAQRVIFLIDAGRMMAGAGNDELTPLDHAFNAILLLAHVALVRGDQVGLLVYSDRMRAYVPPAGGAKRINRLVHAVHNIFPELVESRHDRAFVELEERCRRRSLVILITNLFDDMGAEGLTRHLGNLSGRHLPLAVVLRDRDIFELADRAEGAERSLYRGAAAASMLNWRERVLAGLRQRGALVLDVFPEELTAPLVNRYLEIKARHLL